MAFLSVAARVFIRIHTRRFGLDDYLVLFAFVCLSGSTSVIMKYTRILFIMEATLFNPAYVYTIEDNIESRNSLAVVDCLRSLTWTTTFFVKFSFLVLFRQLISCVSKKITVYFWVVVLFTVPAWAFTCCEPFVSCHYFGESRRRKSVSVHDAMLIFLELCMVLSRQLFLLDATVASLDMTTDIMSSFLPVSSFAKANTHLVIIIPILILRTSLMKLSQKIGLAALLCLSIVMVIVAIVRMTAYAYHPRIIDLTWCAFWIHVESCVAVIMASLSAIRPLFVNWGREKEVDEKKNRAPLPLDEKRHLKRSEKPDNVGWEEMGREG